MKRRYKIAAIDFDGTIKPTEQSFDGTIKPTEQSNLYEPPSQECIQTLHDLKANGWKLVLWTCRAGRNLTAAKNYLSRYEILDLFDEINENVQPMRYKTSQKIVATVYIDDRVIGGFPGWEAVRDELIGGTIARG